MSAPELETAGLRLASRVLGASARLVAELKPGLGAHRFLRVETEEGKRAVIRIETGRVAGSGAEPPLEAVRAFFETGGIPVPRRLGGAAGIEVLEDLGDDSLERRAARGLDEELRKLYENICGLIVRLQHLAAPADGLPAYERHLAHFLAGKRERALAVALPAWLGRDARPAERDCVERAFALVEERVRSAPSRLAHRDLQSSNVLFRGAEPVLIDLQGAFLAPPEYDLVCLLRDSYVALPDAWVRDLCETTRVALPDAPPPELFCERFDLLTLARKTKDDAYFIEAARRGDPRYERFRPTHRTYLCDAAERLTRVDSCFDEWRRWLASPAEVSCAQ